MSVFKGFVGKIFEKTGRGKRGPWTLYSTILKDEHGEDATDWISFGFDPPSVKEGDYVKITLDESGERPKVTEVKKLKNPPARSAKAAAPAEDSGSSSTGKQQYIHYQNSRGAAIDVVRLLAEYDALALPKAGTKPSEAKRFAILTQAIDKLTVQYFNDIETMRLLETVADAGAISTEPDSPLPDDAGGDPPEEDEDEAEEEEDEDDDE